MLVETSYLTNTKKLVCSYVDKSGEIKLKYYDWDTPMKYVSCDDVIIKKIKIFELKSKTNWSKPPW